MTTPRRGLAALTLACALMAASGAHGYQAAYDSRVEPGGVRRTLVRYASDDGRGSLELACRGGRLHAIVYYPEVLAGPQAASYRFEGTPGDAVTWSTAGNRMGGLVIEPLPFLRAALVAPAVTIAAREAGGVERSLRFTLIDPAGAHAPVSRWISAVLGDCFSLEGPPATLSPPPPDAPAPRAVAAPRWSYEPVYEEVMARYSDTQLMRLAQGTAVVRCINQGGVIDGCVIVADGPYEDEDFGWTFGESAMRVARAYVPRPGSGAAGDLVQLPITFSLKPEWLAVYCPTLEENDRRPPPPGGYRACVSQKVSSFRR